MIRVVTPGDCHGHRPTIAENENNYLLSLCAAEGRVGLSYADVSTGAFYVGECAADEGFASLLLGEVARIQPRGNHLPRGGSGRHRRHGRGHQGSEHLCQRLPILFVREGDSARFAARATSA